MILYEAIKDLRELCVLPGPSHSRLGCDRPTGSHAQAAGPGRDRPGTLSAFARPDALKPPVTK